MLPAAFAHDQGAAAASFNQALVEIDALPLRGTYGSGNGVVLSAVVTEGVALVPLGNVDGPGESGGDEYAGTEESIAQGDSGDVRGRVRHLSEFASSERKVQANETRAVRSCLCIFWRIRSGRRGRNGAYAAIRGGGESVRRARRGLDLRPAVTRGAHKNARTTGNPTVR